MLGIGKFVTKEQRFKLIKNSVIRKLIGWKNKSLHPNESYSIINFTRLFDVNWYLTTYPDVAKANVDPIAHYVQYGANENRNPNDWFNTKAYRDATPLKPHENPFVHFILSHNSIEKIDSYSEWLKAYDNPKSLDVEVIRDKIDNFGYKPLFSIVVPIYNADLQYLAKAYTSISNQLYKNWEICFADDASTNSEVREYLENLAKVDSRVKVIYRDKNGHISEATNSALSIAEGDFVVFMDQDDEVAVDALFEVANALNHNRNLNLIYSDEDKIDETGNRFDPHFKSDWNRILLYGQNYISHLCVVRRAIVEKIGGLRKGFEGSQDYDLVLRVIEQIEESTIHHIPKILYHWRAVGDSTALKIDNKLYAVEAGKRALEEHIKKEYPKSETEIVEGVFYRIKLPIAKPEPLVSIIIPFRDKVELLKVCLDSISSKTTYKKYEILLIDNGSVEEETVEYLKGFVNNKRVKVLKYKKPFNFSAINNFASKKAKGEILCFLNNDIAIITDNWLTEMVSYFTINDVGAVGAKLLFDDDTIQHAGIILGIGGVAGHPHKYQQADTFGYMSRAKLAQNLSAVTAACVAVRRSAFEEVEGFDEQLKVAFNDVDLCIRIREEGYKIIFTPFAQLYHFESKSRGNDNDPDKIERFHSEIKFMQERWGDVLNCDPYFNPNFDLSSEQFQLAFPPRTTDFNLRIKKTVDA